MKKQYRIIYQDGKKSRWKDYSWLSEEEFNEYEWFMKHTFNCTIEKKVSPTIYSVKYFDMQKNAWCKRGIRVEAESRKEAYEKAVEILHQRGKKDKHFLMNCTEIN